MDPQDFPFGVNLYQKLPILTIYLGATKLIFKAAKLKFGVRVWTGDSLLRLKFSRNRLRGLTPYGQILCQQFHGT